MVMVIRSNRKTLAISIKEDLSVTVRAPIRVSKTEIEKILKEKEQWIQKHISLIKEKNSRLDAIKEKPLTDEKLLFRNQGIIKGTDASCTSPTKLWKIP